MSTLNGETLNIEKQNIKKLTALFPEIKSDEKIDFEKLKQILGEYVEDSDERYRFVWNGKGEALKLSQTPSMGTLRPAKEAEESKHWDDTENLYIEGDNLEVLKLLQKSYFNKVKMVYIDPPYNTGGDFVYEDNFKDNIQHYKKVTGQVDAEGKATTTNREHSGRYHTDWLSMMYPRLRLARNLLTDDGIIFISIDDHELDNLKKICDEIFGENNFVARLVWTNKEGGGSSDSKNFRVKHEYMLVYAKMESEVEINGLPVEDTDRYRLSDEYESTRGRHQLIKLDSASIQYSSSLDYPISAPDGTDIYPAHGERQSCWRWGKEKLKWGIEHDFVVIKKDSTDRWAVYTKQYLNCDNEGNIIARTIQPTGIIDEFSTTQSNRHLINLMDGKVFDYSKPVHLMKYILEIGTSSDSLILDFFAGSSTMAHATMQLNAEDNGHRKFIMAQLPEETAEKSAAYKAGYTHIAEIGKARIRRAGEHVKKELNEKYEAANELERKQMIHPDELDTGFKVFKLDTSNIKEWNPGSYENVQLAIEDAQHPYVAGRTEADVVYEMMLKMGLDLTCPVEEYDVDGKTIYSIDNGFLMICLADHIDVAVAKKMIELKEANGQQAFRTIFRDEGFASDTNKTNVKETLRTSGLADESFITL